MEHRVSFCCFRENHLVIALTIVNNIIIALIALLLLIRTGRIIVNQHDQADTCLTAHNLQIKKLRDVQDSIEHALDCLLTLDYQAAAATGEDD
jgi:hypothetical protein